MLVDYTLFGVVDKVQQAIDLLQQHEPPEGYYVCFSGGKDSVVLLDLVIRSGVQFDAHHSVTTVEPPELMRFIRDHYPFVHKESPKYTMAQLIVRRKMPPLRVNRYCCQTLKERKGFGRFKVTGIRNAESIRRVKRQQVEDDKYSTGKFIHPIKFWSDADIWQYIHERNLPYCSLYDCGFHRIGCVLCPFEGYLQALQDLERFPAIADYYRRACRKSFEVNRDKLTNWASGDEMFFWWIDTRRHVRIAEDCNSIPLFSEDDGSIL